MSIAQSPISYGYTAFSLAVTVVDVSYKEEQKERETL
jgi:hypothetical protein